MVKNKNKMKNKSTITSYQIMNYLNSINLVLSMGKYHYGSIELQKKLSLKIKLNYKIKKTLFNNLNIGFNTKI